MVKRRRMRGYSLMEVVVAMAVFGIFLMIVTILMLEMSKQEKRFPVNFMQNPQIIGVLGRLRRDVQDAYENDPYLSELEGYTQGSKTLIIRTIVNGGEQKVIWDFTTPGEAHRISYNVGVKSEWVARGLPPEFDVKIKSEEIPGRPYGARIQAKDKNGKLSIDQILQPRAHE